MKKQTKTTRRTYTQYLELVRDKHGAVCQIVPITDGTVVKLSDGRWGLMAMGAVVVALEAADVLAVEVPLGHQLQGEIAAKEILEGRLNMRRLQPLVPHHA